MFVQLKRDIIPICDLDGTQMRLVEFTAPNIAMTGLVYKCMHSSCARAYSNSFGYHYATDHFSFEDSYKRLCEKCGTFLYIESVTADTGIEIWRCGQIRCNYSEEINPEERFRIALIPMPTAGDTKAKDVPFAMMEAQSISNGERRSTGLQSWSYLQKLLGQIGQAWNQIESIRQSLTANIGCELSERSRTLAIKEKQVVRLNMIRMHTSS